MEPAEATPPAEPAENAGAIAAASAEYPEADHAEPPSAAAQHENGAGADIEGAPPEGLNGLPLSKSQAKKRAKYAAKQAQKAERKEREKRHVYDKCPLRGCCIRQERDILSFGQIASRAWRCKPVCLAGFCLHPSQLLSRDGQSHPPKHIRREYETQVSAYLQVHAV